MTIASGSPALAADILKHANSAGELELAGSVELTISSGEVVAAQNWHLVDTEGDAATDDLNTITKQDDMDDGFILFLRAAHTDRTVAIKHNTGNILSVDGNDIWLDDSSDFAILIYDGNLSKWLALGVRPADGTTLEQVQGKIRVKDGGISADKLAADSVDDTKVGNRVPQFYRRQGGSATDWSTAGTTTRTPTTVRMQAGVVSVAEGGTISVTFPTAFSQPPIVHLTPFMAGISDPLVAGITSVTASTFEGKLFFKDSDLAGGLGEAVNWLAIGPE